MPLPFVNSLYWAHTNWTSFDYDAIAFENNKPIALMTPPLPPQLKFTVTLFNYINKEKPFCVVMNMPQDQIMSAKKWGEENKLYQLEEVAE